jgi:hypothetical protein
MAETDSYISSHPAQFRAIAAKHLTISPATLKALTLPVFTDQLTAADIAAWEKSAEQFHLMGGAPASASVLETVR